MGEKWSSSPLTKMAFHLVVVAISGWPQCCHHTPEHQGTLFLFCSRRYIPCKHTAFQGERSLINKSFGISLKITVLGKTFLVCYLLQGVCHLGMSLLLQGKLSEYLPQLLSGRWTIRSKVSYINEPWKWVTTTFIVSCGVALVCYWLAALVALNKLRK